MRRLAQRAGVAALWLSTVASAAEEVPLGSSEAVLRERHGEALREVRVERARSLHEQVYELRRPAGQAPDATAATASTEKSAPGGESGASEAAPDPYARQRRLAREVGGGDVRRIEYDLLDGRVYRIRWQLAERFERPLMGPVVARLSERLGSPHYDQTLKAKLGSGRADLRRTGWERGGRALEVRQLHPFVGGPLYVTLADGAALQAIVAAGGAALPQPEEPGDWWRRPQQPPRLLEPEERDALLAALDGLIAQLPF
jgi:hypothetical protein